MIGNPADQVTNSGRSLSRDNAELSHMATYGIDQLDPLSNQCLAHAMKNQLALLFLTLDRHEPHGRSLDRFANRFGISGFF